MELSATTDRPFANPVGCAARSAEIMPDLVDWGLVGVSFPIQKIISEAEPMNVDGIQQLMFRRESGELTDVQYLDESRRVISGLHARNPEEEVEKKAMLQYIESLRIRALYWENREIESLADEVESWLCEPTV